MLCTYCTFLNQTAFNIQNPQSNTTLQNINSHLHAQYCKTHRQWVSKLCGNIQSQTTTVFPKEQWSMTVWISRTYCQRTTPKLPALNFLCILSCSYNNFVYVCYGTCLERHLECWNTALSPNMKRKWNIHPPNCLQTPEEESIKHNIGFLSWRLPVGFETPMWRRRLYFHIWKHQSFILMFELINGEYHQNKKIWCCLRDLWPSEIRLPVFKSMFGGIHFTSP